MTQDSQRIRSSRWAELDILRGWAALLMIVNHVGYRTLSDELIAVPLVSAVLFVSSAAPVLFFFVTGVGFGLQADKANKKATAVYWYDTIYKLGLLCLADLLMQWSQGRTWGLDFLAFIGLSGFLLAIIRVTRWPTWICGVGLLVVSGLRFVVGPQLRDTALGTGVGGWLLGTVQNPGVSYPLSPWLAYPFAGYLVGALACRSKDWVESNRNQTLALMGLATLVTTLAAFAMKQLGESFNRWGTVNTGFYVAGYAVISGFVLFSFVAVRFSAFRFVSRLLTLEGIASFATVPIHYLLIHRLNVWRPAASTPSAYFARSLVILVLSFWLAVCVQFLAKLGRRSERRFYWWVTLVVMVAVGCALTLFTPGSSMAMLGQTIGQLALCLLLVVRLAGNSASPNPGKEVKPVTHA